MKNNSRIYIGIIAVCILAGAVAAVVFLPLQTVSETPSEEVMQDAVNDELIEIDTPQEDVREVVEKKPAPTCAEKMIADAEERDLNYEEGSILVSFTQGLTYEEARSALLRYDLEVKKEEGVESNIPLGNWVTVLVPKGEEFEWICTLREQSEVRHAGLNLLFELRQ